MRFSLSLLTLFAATPAWAHAGAHAHPHGLEALGALLAVAVVGAVVWRVRSR